MKSVLTMGLCVAALTLMPKMQAQYCGAINTGQYFTCSAASDQGPCSQQIANTNFINVQGGYFISAGFVSCCGQNYRTYYYQGGTCRNAELKSPEVQERLRKVAQHKIVLVATCNGRYDSFVAYAESPKPATIHLQPALSVDSGQ